MISARGRNGTNGPQSLVRRKNVQRQSPEIAMIILIHVPRRWRGGFRRRGGSIHDARSMVYKEPNYLRRMMKASTFALLTQEDGNSQCDLARKV